MNAELRLTELLKSLVGAEIEFLVFGIVAASFHGYVRATHDLDVIVRPTSENVERLIAWLSRHDAHLGSDPDRALGTNHFRRLRMGHNAWVLTPYGNLDIVQHIDGLPGWEELAARAVSFDVAAMRLQVVDRATLIARKRARATPQDLVDADALEALGAE